MTLQKGDTVVIHGWSDDWFNSPPPFIIGREQIVSSVENDGFMTKKGWWIVFEYVEWSYAHNDHTLNATITICSLKEI